MLYTAIKKEGKQLFGDKVFLLIALVQPIILIIMFLNMDLELEFQIPQAVLLIIIMYQVVALDFI